MVVAPTIDAVASSSSVVTTQCLEGTGVATPQGAGTVAAFQRLENETKDTDNNAADFAGPSAGDPQNKAGGGGEPEPTVTKIHSIQGPGATTPLANQIVTIEGVVVGHDDEDGFNFASNFPEDRGIFVQEEAADQDTNSSTSEGIFVGFVDNVLDYPLGSVVRVEGQAKEKFGLTMIAESIGQEPEIIGSVSLPDPVTIDPALAEAQTESNKTYYEMLENMRVRFAEGTANSGGTTKFGELFLTPGTERDRVFRVESEPALLATDADAGAGDPQNPYKDEDGSFTTVEGDLFDTVQNVIGPLAFSFNHYKIMVQANAMPTVIKGPTSYPFTGVERGRSKRTARCVIQRGELLRHRRDIRPHTGDSGGIRGQARQHHRCYRPSSEATGHRRRPGGLDYRGPRGHCRVNSVVTALISSPETMSGVSTSVS